MNIGDLYYTFRGEGQALMADAKKEGAKAGEVASTGFAKSWAGRVKKLGKTELGAGLISGLGVSAFAGIGSAAALATQSVLGFAQESIAAASDLNETISKSNTIFGESGKAIEAWAGTMASSAGQSKKAALDAAAGFAGLFDTVGIAGEQSADMAKDLTQLGSDLASFFNTDVASALGAIRSGLSGESEPLRRFNVFLSETAVSAKLAQMGIKKVGGAFTEAQKATARYQLIMEQTSTAQGDFARTADGMANQQRILEAEMANLSAEIGQELLPLSLQFGQAMKDVVLPALRDVFRFLKDNQFFIEAFGFAIENVLKGPLGATLDAARRKQEEYLENQRKNLALVAEQWGDTADGATEAQRELNRGMAGTTSNMGELAGSAEGAAAGMSGVAGATNDTTDAAKKAAKPVETLEERIKGLAEKSGDATDAMLDLIAIAADESAAVEILEGKIAETTQEVVDLESELKKLKAIKNPTGEQRRDIESTEGQLAAARAELTKFRSQLIVLGKTGAGGLLAQMRELARQTGRTGAAAEIAYIWLRRMSRLSIPMVDVGQKRTAGPERGQHGGVFPAGEPVIVGEVGQELFVPSVGGRIIPHDVVRKMGGTAGATTNNYNVQVQGLVQARDPLEIAFQTRRVVELGRGVVGAGINERSLSLLGEPPRRR